MKVKLRVGFDSVETDVASLEALDTFLKADALAIKKMLMQINKTLDIKMEERIDNGVKSVTIDAPVVAQKPQEIAGTCDKCGSNAGFTTRTASGRTKPQNKGRKFIVCNDCGEFIRFIT